jgi:acyl-CoA thioester hydrolase
MHRILGRYPVSISVPVAWGEMDSFQHVNNCAFVRWVESARVAYFSRLGLMRPDRSEGLGPILARVAIDYRRPVTYPDTVRVDATIRAIGKSSLTAAYRIWSTEQRAEVATGEDVIVVYDYATGRKAHVDERLRAAIAALEATAPAAGAAGAGAGG